jgi:hypothetical protein
MRWSRIQTAVALLLVGALACGQVEQELGDGSTGTANDDVQPDPPSTSTPTGGSKGNGTAGSSSVYGAIPTDACFVNGTSCARGYGCLRPWQEDSADPILPGVCAPGCDDASDAGLDQPCAPNAEGTMGVCRPFTVNPDVRYPFQPICTKDCDPLSPDCSAHYSCEVTTATAGTFVFSCLPVTRHEPLLEGESCDGLPMGQCAPGLSCVSRGSFAKCSKYCGLGDPSACPSPQSCVMPRDFPDGSVGICGDPD